MNIHVTPTCCPEIRQERAIEIVIDDLETVPWTPIWRLLLASVYDRYDADDSSWFLRPQPAPKCCPYCSTALPAIEPRTGITAPVWRGDMDCCNTCGERDMGCTCLPPWATFQLAGGDDLDVNALWHQSEADRRANVGE